MKLRKIGKLARVYSALAEMRKGSRVERRSWSDRFADRFCELASPLFDKVGENEDTETEVRRGFTLVWNRAGLWRVDVRRGVVAQIV